MEPTVTIVEREPEVLNEYDSIIKEQLSAAVIEKVSELVELGENVHYLPHHSVIRRDAETPGGGGVTPIHYLYGHVPANGVVILKLLV